MSDLAQVVLNLFSGSQVVKVKKVPAKRVSSAKRKRLDFSNEDFERKTKEKKESPYGLASLDNNWLKSCEKLNDLKNGYIDDSDIINDFKKMLMRVNGKRSPLLVNDKGEVMTFPVKSRWNEDYHYGYVVGQKALDEVKGLRKVKHLILTIAPERLKSIIPDWWCFGDEEFMSVIGGRLVSEFLRKLRTYKKKNGEPNNFITWVMEYQQNGMVHFHLLFYGSWVAPIDVLSRCWPYSDENGIRFGRPIRHQDNGYVLAKYLTRYITKDLQQIDDKNMKKKMERIKAFLWFFKRRLYNIRHKIKNSDGEHTLGIGREQFVNPIKWQKYVQPTNPISDDHFSEEINLLQNNSS